MDVEIGDVTPANLQQFRLINTSTLPVRYTDKFYNDLLGPNSQVSPQNIKLAYNNGFSIGTVCARREEKDGDVKMYIMILNVLAAYRRRGVASKLLNHIFENAAKDPTVSEVYLHVHTTNKEAIDFYLSKGFENVEEIKDYYKHISPPDAYKLRLGIESVREMLAKQAAGK